MGWFSKKPKEPEPPKPPPWRCRLCKEKEFDGGLLPKSRSTSDPTLCDFCVEVERQWKADRRKRQEELAAMVAGGLKYTAYRGERPDAEVAAEAMKIAKAIMNHR